MSNYEIIETSNVPIKAWTRGVGIEDSARKQLENTARLPIIFRHVAVMPDVHFGIGATVGSVVPTEGAIIPAAVGVDIGCFTGDTEIPLASGASRRLDELAAAGEELTVYACTPTGRIVFAKARAHHTQSEAALVRITLDNTREICCTPDHQFMRRDGSYVRADELAEGDSLMPLYRECDRDGYELVQQNYSGRMQKAHWIVARSGLLGPVPKFDGQRTVIHHVDFNESNNDPSNLEFMGANDHSSYHRMLVERNEHWQSPEFEAQRVAALRRKAETPEGHVATTRASAGARRAAR
jgi:tRNA-splicing ligase RtcB